MVRQRRSAGLLDLFLTRAYAGLVISPHSAEINISRIPVAGFGGLGMVAGSGVLAVVLPEARSVLLAGVAGGAVLGAIFIFLRRHPKHDRPSGDSPVVLFREDVARPEASQVRATPSSEGSIRGSRRHADLGICSS
jgi:hypothetical protein